MAAIEVASLPAHLSASQLWPELARQCSAWLARESLAARDAVLLLPYAALLPHARAAFAAMGDWQPRIETPLTLAASLAPPRVAGAGELSGDTTLDGITAAGMLRGQRWAREWQQRDARGFDQLVARVVEAAQALASTAGGIAPSARADYWAQVRDAVALGRVANIESALLDVAVAWAELGAPVATDALFELTPSAWIALRIGGADAVTDAVLAAAPSKALRVDADVAGDDPFAAFVEAAVKAQTAEPQRSVCDGVEAEVQACAGIVIDALNAGRRPLAVVVLDRVLARRLRSQLARAGVSIADETGWRLSTTPAAARVMATLAAAAPHARADDWLAWLKGELVDADSAPWVLQLEALWRRARVSATPDEQAGAMARWQQFKQRLVRLTALATRTSAPASLRDWLAALHATLGDAAPSGDAALVHAALRLGSDDAAWLGAASSLSMTLPDFMAWVDSVLDAANLEPPRQADADVVLTPLARAIGRPFAMVVVPGADETRLGAASVRPSLISERLAQQLGLASASQRLTRERLALAQLLRSPALHFVRRRLDADAPVAASPLLQWLAASWAQAEGRAASAEVVWAAATRSAVLTPQIRPQPRAPAHLPEALSASSVAALRDCPYRFFARSVLHLNERDEIDAPLDKREYGNWLHLALHLFHQQRDAAVAPALATAPDTLTALLRSASDAAQAMQLDAAALLPFQTSFENFAPAYLAWLATREAQGHCWQSGEADYQAAPEVLAPQRMAGRIDRIDLGPDGAFQIIDYKTSGGAALKRRVGQPLEDTQLPFYAALVMGASPAAEVAAIYLTLDDTNSPVEVPHPDVMATAATLLAGLADDFAALRAGAAMPALGDGEVCNYCEMRGLCRRDHWLPVS